MGWRTRLLGYPVLWPSAAQGWPKARPDACRARGRADSEPRSIAAPARWSLPCGRGRPLSLRRRQAQKRQFGLRQSQRDDNFFRQSSDCLKGHKLTSVL
ncbi:hypothetical protein FRY97_13425 [Phaeodactylibacter luteus]|uniref:Uncharacterized protein n=1 Tax=Phaeodactylibacter luteus TaxID=1564516 RepID=A0A5C6RKY7_9BACT|nr:hypothetical protein FRY97_13425 [Phaeodactylibacter luteus]